MPSRTLLDDWLGRQIVRPKLLDNAAAAFLLFCWQPRVRRGFDPSQRPAAAAAARPGASRSSAAQRHEQDHHPQRQQGIETCPFSLRDAAPRPSPPSSKHPPTPPRQRLSCRSPSVPRLAALSSTKLPSAAMGPELASSPSPFSSPAAPTTPTTSTSDFPEPLSFQLSPSTVRKKGPTLSLRPPSPPQAVPPSAMPCSTSSSSLGVRPHSARPAHLYDLPALSPSTPAALSSAAPAPSPTRRGHARTRSDADTAVPPRQLYASAVPSKRDSSPPGRSPIPKAYVRQTLNRLAPQFYQKSATADVTICASTPASRAREPSCFRAPFVCGSAKSDDACPPARPRTSAATADPACAGDLAAHAATECGSESASAVVRTASLGRDVRALFASTPPRGLRARR